MRGRSFQAKSWTVAFRATLITGTVGTRFPKCICYDAWMLQSLWLGANPRAFPRRRPTNSCWGRQKSRRVSQAQVDLSICCWYVANWHTWYRTPNKSEDPNGFYSTDYYTNRLIQYFENRSEEDHSKPFFAFLAYTAPHWPLQCSKAQREK